MITQFKTRGAFTLLEVALSIGVLMVGLTAVISVYMVSLGWAEEIRVDLTALQTARIVMADAAVLTDDKDVPAGYTNRDPEARGWINDYYVVRSFDPAAVETLPHNGGDYVKLEVKVYYGGDDSDGMLAHRLFCHQVLLKEYNP